VNVVGRAMTALRDVSRYMRRWIASLPDRWSHAARHRRAVALAHTISQPTTILIVCEGNVCRSPYMAAVLRQLLPDIEIVAAGLIGSGRAMPEHGLAIATQRGLDLTAHRSQRLSREMTNRADLVVVMDARQAAHVRRAFHVAADRVILAGDLDPDGSRGRTIRDPWQQSRRVFESSFSRIDRASVVLSRALRRSRARS
jgi:protein-tyrosine phosphatase